MSPRVRDGPDVPKHACQTRHPSYHDLAVASLRVRGVGLAAALLRVIRDAATLGKAEISESDVPLACAATPSRSRRNDVDEEDGCRDSASETTPQRL